MSKWILALLISAVYSFGYSQNHTIRGTISQEDGSPLIGVNILVKGDIGTGTTSDFNGNYELVLNASDGILIFSYIGFAEVELEVGGRTVLDVVMQESGELLDEIVVVGYGVQRKSDLTGAVSTVKAKEITKIPTSSVSQALQGKVAGVQVTPVSGEPGASAIIRIRGVGTLNDASPLFVVDGMLLDDINFLNPNDVESVEVLKDASATAIYGSRGANGVIIISTKKGNLNKEATFEFSTYLGTQEVVRQIDLVNADQFALLANEVATNESILRPFADSTLFGEGTNWQDEVLQKSPIRNYQLSVNGGSDKMTYNVSGNYFKQEGIVKGSEFERFTLRINNEYKLKD